MKRIFILSILCFATVTAFGQVGNNNPMGPYGEFNGNITTGCSYDPFTGNAKRSITDMTVYGAVGKFGLNYSRTWNTRYGVWQGSFDWTINSVIGIPSSQAMYYVVHFPDGRVSTWTNPGPTTTAGIHERIIEAGNLLYVVLTDGSKVEFAQTHTTYMGYDQFDNWTQLNDYTFSVNAITDPFGQRTNFTHNTDGTISKVTEPAGRYWPDPKSWTGYKCSSAGCLIG